MTHHLQLDTLTLRFGPHDRPESGMCLLEAVAYFAHEPHSDRPKCVDRTLAAFGRSWNDGMRTDDERAQLKPYVPALVGTAGTSEDAERRAWLAFDWSVRVSTPAWLDLAGLSEQASRLRCLPEQTAFDGDVEGLLRLVREDAAAAGAAARDAARAAAWAAAGDGAWDALEPTVTTLQQSAHDLYRRMIAAGPHDPDALADIA